MARSPRKTPDQVYEEAVEQVESARYRGAWDLNIGKERKSLLKLPPLDGLTQLRRLQISKARLSDISEIRKLTNLETLYLNDTLVSDLSAVDGLKRLKSIVVLNCPLKTLPTLNLPLLERFRAVGGSASDISGLSDLPSIVNLELQLSQLSNLTPISKLKTLKTLNIHRSKVSDLSPLASLPVLESLVIAHAPLKDLAPLAKVLSLQDLNIAGTEVTDLSPIQNLPNLERIWAADTGVVDIGPLEKLISLKRLGLDRTNVWDLRPISDLELTRLDIDYTKVTDLTPLARQVSMARAVAESRYSLAGLWYENCPLTDNYLLGLSVRENPERTLEAISYLRQREGLPPLPDFRRERGDEPPDLPPQGPGPHFAIDNDGIISFAAPKALDSSGNNLQRLKTLQPHLLEAAGAALSSISKNQHPGLHSLVERYQDAIDKDIDEIDFNQLYGIGLRLQTSAAAADREIAERLLPELEDPAREALDGLTSLHGPFILSTKDGLELIEAAERYSRRPEDETALREAAVELGFELENQPDILEPEAAAFIRESAEDIDSGPHPQRGTSYGLGTAKNVSIVLVAGATCGALPIIGGFAGGPPGVILGGLAALLGVEGLKKSKPFAEFSGALAKKIDDAAAIELDQVLRGKAESFAPHLKFVLTHEKLLRKLAGDRLQFRWLHSYLDWLKAYANRREE